MACNREDCPISGDHMHLLLADQIALALVLEKMRAQEDGDDEP